MPNTAGKPAVPLTRAAAASPASNAEKAHALIAMLGTGGTNATSIAPERLRDWARDLVETVEGRAGMAQTPAPSPAAPKTTRVFTKPAPRLRLDPVAPTADASEPVRRPTVGPRLTLTAPEPYRPDRRAETPLQSTMLAPDSVHRLIAETFDTASMAREHPAVIAMSLMGKPSLEQASDLRALPGGQVRAVHRALRQLEQGAR
jgi:hypothetical protein